MILKVVKKMFLKLGIFPLNSLEFILIIEKNRLKCTNTHFESSQSITSLQLN